MSTLFWSIFLIASVSSIHECVYWHKEPIEITLDYILGSIQIRNIMEISFDLKIRSNPSNSCPATNLYCHIFSIEDRFPLIYTEPLQRLTIESRINAGNGIEGMESTDIYPIIMDLNWHSLYLKFSFTDRIVIIDNITYRNAQGSFDNSNFINQTHDITTVWGDPSGNQYVHNGTIKNLCINSVYQIPNPTIYPSNNPTLHPSSNPTLIPSNSPTLIPTLNPSNIPTSNPSNIPISNPSNIPTSNPTIAPSYMSSQNTTEIPTSRPSVYISVKTPTSHIDRDRETMETTNTKTVTGILTDKKDPNANALPFWPIIISLIGLICISCLFWILCIVKKVKKDKKLGANQKQSIAEMVDNKYNIHRSRIQSQSNILFNNVRNDKIDTNNASVNNEIIVEHNDHTPNSDEPYVDVDDETPNTESTGESDHPLNTKAKNAITSNVMSVKEKKMDNEFEEVRDWLVNKVRLPQYFQMFVQHGYISMDVILEQIKDKCMLNEIGIELKGHQTKIIAEIRRLRAKHSNEMAYKSVFDDTYQGNDLIIDGEHENVTDDGNNEIHNVGGTPQSTTT